MNGLLTWYKKRRCNYITAVMPINDILKYKVYINVTEINQVII